MAGQHLVLYDGVCGLCNNVVQFVLRRDEMGTFDFASLQSATGRGWLHRFGRDAGDLGTMIVVTNYRGGAPALPALSERQRVEGSERQRVEGPSMISKARAVLFIATALGQPWRSAAILEALPESFLNRVYDFIARRRYRVFGRSDTCILPRPEQRDRVIDV